MDESSVEDKWLRKRECQCQEKCLNQMNFAVYHMFLVVVFLIVGAGRVERHTGVFARLGDLRTKCPSGRPEHPPYWHYSKL